MGVMENRRQVFRWLAGSLALTPAARAVAQQLATSRDPAVIAAAKDGLQIMDFEPAA